ncbi:MAG TPA: hypothetical protein VGP62_28935 [Bryobacteraceae bacterium]|nr:hypothetical protein [Bryobacteraceae bacterium]
MSPDDQPEPDGAKTGPKFYTALACYGAIALAAAVTLDGTFRLVVWIFLAGLAAKTYLHTLRKP